MKYIAILAVCLAAFFAIDHAFTAGERQECIQWHIERESLTGAPLHAFIEQWREWQEQQCEAVGVRVF